MKLYRLCCQQEIDAIKENGFEKLTFGGCLFRYAGFTETNDYKIYKNLWKEVNACKRENRITPILKCFPDIPKEIMLFEKDINKRRESCQTFVPKGGYFENESNKRNLAPEIFNVLNDPSKDFDEVFLYTIKVAGFFDTLEDIKACYCDLASSATKILEIDFSQEVALKFKGEGRYGFSKFHREYALPMFMLKPEHIVSEFELGVEEIKEIQKKEMESVLNFIKKAEKEGKVEMLESDFQNEK